MQRPKSAIFSLCAYGCVDVWDGWMDVVVFFVHDFFHTAEPIEKKLKLYHYFNKMKRWLVFGTYRLTTICTLFQYFFSFFEIFWKWQPILMRFNILVKYLGHHKKGYIMFIVKLYFKVVYSMVVLFFKFFKIYSFDRFNTAHLTLLK